jgi:hypothetical protein
VETPRKFINAIYLLMCFHKQNNYIFNRHANIQRTPHTNLQKTHHGVLDNTPYTDFGKHACTVCTGNCFLITYNKSNHQSR